MELVNMNKVDEKKLSVLIVDDVPKNIQLVANFLTEEGYELHFAQSGQAALKQMENKVFDLILLDIMMPGMDGLEVCRRIKENKRTQNIPVIFLTAKIDDESIANGFRAGGVDYIMKPFNPVELVARVKTHIHLRMREMELSGLNATKDTLFSVISHDLKTPFFNILGLGELLLSNFDEYEPGMIKELITNMVDASRSAHNLLDNLLNWTRIQTGKIVYKPEMFALKDIIEENINFISMQASNKEIHCSCSGDQNLMVFADINMLRTILRNLLSNAVKYTPRGGSIEIKTAIQGSEAITEVSDTGIGISPDKLRKLSEANEMVSTPGTEMEPGTGFGLILTRDFIDKNKGRMEIESSEGKGTIFRFTLPLKEVNV
jgi:signal transduction histidine kinase